MNSKIRVLRPQHDDKLEQLAGRLREKSTDKLTGLLRAFFDGADDMLFAMAEKAESNQHQNLYFDTMRSLRLERETITRVFMQAFHEGFSAEVKTDQGSQPEFGDLSLVEEEELEEKVALSNMETKAAGLFTLPISHLQMRLEWLAQNHVAINPQFLSPRHLCKAFQVAMQPRDMDLSIKLVIYKLFDKQLMSQLGPIYEAANGLLVEGGILPEIRYGRRGRNEGVSAPAAGPSAAGSTQASAAPVEYLGRQDLAQALVALQGDAASAGDQEGWDAELATAALLRQLTRQQDSGHSRRVQDEEIQLIDMANALFDEVFNDRLLSKVAKGMLARLQVPVVRAALMDPGFFRNRQHPARALMHELTALAAQVKGPESPMHDKLEELTEQVVREFKDDVSVFDSTLQRMRALSKEEAERFFEEELQQSKARRNSIIEQAKAHVVEVIRQHLKGRVLPEKVRPLLLEGIGPFLVVRYIRHGEESEAWRDGVQMLDELLASVQPPAPEEDVISRVAKGHDLALLLGEQLGTVKFDPHKIATLISGLQATYLDLLDSAECLETNDLLSLEEADLGAESGLDESGEASGSAPASFSEAAVQSNGTSPGQSLDSRAAHAAASMPNEGGASADGEAGLTELSSAAMDFLYQVLRRGDWFMVHQGEGKVVRRLKVHGLNEAEGLLEFADRNMTKCLEMHALDVINDMLRGRTGPLYADFEYEQALSVFRECLQADD